MRLLLIHADKVEYAVTKKTKMAEEIPEKMKNGEMADCLFVKISVEKGDEKNPAAIVDQGVRSITDVAGQVKTRNVLLYPFVHLLFGADPGSASVSLRILKGMEESLSKAGYAVKRAPFGYYKRFTLSCKGHPLAELSRVITAGDAQKKERPAPAAKIVLDRKDLPPNDHRILGQDLQIFTFADEIGAGLPLWLPHGELLKHRLQEYMRRIEERYGYTYVGTPVIAKGRIYEQTGHLPYYQDSMYPPIVIDEEEYYLKPMNCPHHHMIFKRLVNSYRDLPLRLAEAGTTYRKELSGVTYGLIRTKGFTQNDAHIYVTPEQLKEEFIRVLELFREVYADMGITGHWFRLSLPDFKKNPDKYTGDPREWEHACTEIRSAMKEFGQKFVEETGEAAFYGPKIDVQIKNIMGKEETIATNQVDIVIPQRLNLVYTDSTDRKRHVLIIHRAILGSYERFIAYLLEQTGGQLPLWLAPVQVAVLSFTERNISAARAMADALKQKGVRTEADMRNHTVEYKIREAELRKIPYIVVIGDKEEEGRTLAVRRRGEKKVRFGVLLEDFIAQALKEAEEKK